MSSELAKRGNLYRIIVGIDYGTTYSGISYVTSNKSSIDDIVVLSKWPGHPDNTWKAPTRIAYASENSKLTENQWGFGTTQGLKQYAWTKLLLDRKADLTEFDDPLLQEMYGQGFLTLPYGKSAKEVAEDYLRELYKYTMQVLERELTAATLRTMPMECWITTPAIWTHQATSATLEAAKAAGFGSRPGDVVNTISEPEAAALAVLKPHLGPTAIDPIQPKECILVCDCGGGTVDITTFQVHKIEPFLEYQEVCRGTGGKCGSTSIDRSFVEWMTKQFGTAYTSLDMKKRGPGSLFMASFEREKKNFGSKGNDRAFEIGPLHMEVPWSPLYDDDEEFVKLSRHDMGSLFEPSLKEMFKLVDKQAALVKTKAWREIDRFILVGGFGDSAYLNQKLKKWCEQRGIGRFYCPVNCQAAIVKGAALRGLEGITPTTIVAKRHYGWSWGDYFREGIDDEENSYIGLWDGQKFCGGRMHWVIGKDQDLDSLTVAKRIMDVHDILDCGNTYSIDLYSSAFSTPADRVEHPSVLRVGKIVSDISGLKISDLESRFNRRLGRNLFKCSIQIEVRFRSQQGNLAFRTLISGREVGKTTISYT